MATKILADMKSKKVPGITNPLGKRLFTLREAAQYLGRSVWGMRDLIWKQLIPVVVNAGGKKIFIDIVDLDEYINSNKTTYR